MSMWCAHKEQALNRKGKLMKKKLVAMLLVGAMALSSTACGSTPKNERKSATSTDQSSDDGEELKAEKNLLSVEVTLPASLVKDGEAELDEEAKEAGVKEITKNEDGSITMKMTKEAHKELLGSIKESVDESNEEIIADKENYPSIESITYNDALTEFTVSVDSASFNGLESFVAIAFYMEGNIYQALNAVPEDEINTTVNFVDKDSGEVINSADSSSMKDQQ